MVEDGWQAELTARNHLVLARVVPLDRQHAIGTEADPVMLEVFNNLFMSIAEQMGVSLQNTAYSVNIKERLDFSCAVFAHDGTLVANAPHMPVHLGSMDRAVETIIRENKGRIAPGDVYVINAPYNGGTHIPDITVCTPVFDDDGREILFWVASRGHHADIGGTAPGSMSPLATTIEEEGIYIDNFKLVDRGRFRETELYDLLTNAKYPARNPLQNVNDMKAQIAANEKGVQELRRMVAHFTLPVVHAYMQHVQDNAAESVRRVIDRLHDSAFRYEMDQGCVISVKITVDKHKREATVDFTGTSPQQPTNFNAPEPVTRAAVLYVFRVMVDDDIPMNAGCLRPINIVIPKRSMLTPEYPAAVVAGNVEVSQAVTDTLFGALGAMAGAQGIDEQSQLRQRQVPVLRDDLLGLAGRPRLRRHRRGAHPHDQHAAHRSRGARIPLSGRAGGFPHPPALGRPRQVDGGQRRPPHHPLPRADGMHDPVRPPPRAAVRARRRRAGPDRRELGAPQGRPHGAAPGRGRDGDRRGRSGHHPDADGGGIRRSARAEILKLRFDPRERKLSALTRAPPARRPRGPPAPRWR